MMRRIALLSLMCGFPLLICQPWIGDMLFGVALLAVAGVAGVALLVARRWPAQAGPDFPARVLNPVWGLWMIATIAVLIERGDWSVVIGGAICYSVLYLIFGKGKASGDTTRD